MRRSDQLRHKDGTTDDPNTFLLNSFTMRPGRQTGAHTAGVLLNKMQSTVLGRYVPRVVDQPDGLNRAIRIMVENQRLVAKADEKVGLDAQCVCLPRVPQAPGIMLSNLDGHSIPTTNNSFGFFDATASGTSKLVRYWHTVAASWINSREPPTLRILTIKQSDLGT
jgi:hypothetical protein